MRIPCQKVDRRAALVAARRHPLASRMLACYAGTGHRQRRTLLREDHRQQLCGLRLAGVLRDLVRRAGLLVEHLAGGVGLFLALSRDLRHDGALEHVCEHEAGVVVGGADSSWRIVDVAHRHLPAVHRHIRKVVFEDRGRRSGRGLRAASRGRPDARSSAKSANEATASRRFSMRRIIRRPTARMSPRRAKHPFLGGLGGIGGSFKRPPLTPPASPLDSLWEQPISPTPRMSKRETERVELLQGTLDLLILRTLAPGHGARPRDRQGDRAELRRSAQGGTKARSIRRCIVSSSAAGSLRARHVRKQSPRQILSAHRERAPKQLAVETSKWERLARAIARVLRPA